MIALMIWGLGLLAFTGRVDQSTPAKEPPVADGVVMRLKYLPSVFTADGVQYFAQSSQ